MPPTPPIQTKSQPTMPRHPAKDKPSDKTKEEAMKVARATQRPGQTKEQTKLIAQGIQKGIEQYKKQQKAKLREIDKRKKKGAAAKAAEHSLPQTPPESESRSSNKLPWLLLILSWLGFVGYLVVG